MTVDKCLITIVGYKMTKNINHLVDVMLILAVHIVCYYRNVKGIFHFFGKYAHFTTPQEFNPFSRSPVLVVPLLA